MIGFFPFQYSFMIKKEQCVVFPTKVVSEITSPCKKEAQENNFFQLHKSAPLNFKIIHCVNFQKHVQLCYMDIRFLYS